MHWSAWQSKGTAMLRTPGVNSTSCARRSVTEEDLTIALRSLPPHVAVEEKKQQAENDHWSAKQALGTVGSQITRLESGLRKLEPDRQRLQIETWEESVTEGMTPEQADEAAARAESDRTAALAGAQEAGHRAHEVNEKVLQTQNQVTKCDAVTRRLNDIREAPRRFAQRSWNSSFYRSRHGRHRRGRRCRDAGACG